MDYLHEVIIKIIKRICKKTLKYISWDNGCLLLSKKRNVSNIKTEKEQNDRTHSTIDFSTTIMYKNHTKTKKFLTKIKKRRFYYKRYEKENIDRK